MAEKLKNIMVIGQTGVGKSAICNLIGRHLQADPNFVESGDAHSCTKDVVDLVKAGIRLVDVPGLLDSQGIQEDRDNIKKIVLYAKEIGHLNALLLLINFRQSRFDDAILNAVKLHVDSFGRGCLSNIGFVYTKFQFSEKSKKKLEELNVQHRAMIEKRCNCQLGEVPYYYVDCHPEDLALDEAPETRIAFVREQSSQQIQDMLSWVEVSTPFSTKYAAFGEYELDRLRREAELKAVELQKQKEEAEKKAEFARICSIMLSIVRNKADDCEKELRKYVPATAGLNVVIVRITNEMQATVTQVLEQFDSDAPGLCTSEEVFHAERAAFEGKALNEQERVEEACKTRMKEMSERETRELCQAAMKRLEDKKQALVDEMVEAGPVEERDIEDPAEEMGNAINKEVKWYKQQTQALSQNFPNTTLANLNRLKDKAGSLVVDLREKYVHHRNLKIKQIEEFKMSDLKRVGRGFLAGAGTVVSAIGTGASTLLSVFVPPLGLPLVALNAAGVGANEALLVHTVSEAIDASKEDKRRVEKMKH